MSSLPNPHTHKLLLELLSDPSLRARFEALTSNSLSSLTSINSLSSSNTQPPPPYTEDEEEAEEGDEDDEDEDEDDDDAMIAQALAYDRETAAANAAATNASAEAEAQREGEEGCEPDTLHISARTTVHGTRNVVALDAPVVAARLVAAVTAILNPVPRFSSVPMAAATPQRPRRPLRITVDCGVSVRGSWNVVGGAFGVRRVGAGVLVGQGQAAQGQGVKRKAEGDGKEDGKGDGEGEGQAVEGKKMRVE